MIINTQSKTFISGLLSYQFMTLLFFIISKLSLSQLYINFNKLQINLTNNNKSKSRMEKTQGISKLRSNSIRTRSSKVDSSHKTPLEIIPSEVVFKDIQINQYYEITVQIRNLTQRSKRIRIQQPPNTNFNVQYVMQPQIAPGLSMIAKIKYQCKELKNQTEMIKVLCDEGSLVELPVRVYKTESQILFEPFINFGFVKVGKTHEEVVAIKNVGKATGTIQFQHDHGAALIVQPKVLRISPKDEAKVTIKYKATDPGLFKGSITLKSQSILVKDKIDIHATSVQFARFVVDGKGAQNSTFDFGTLYVGQQMIMKGFVVNNSPKKMSFKSIFRKGYLVSPQEFALVQTPAQIGIQQSQRVMFMQPQLDSIEPFKQCEVRFICRTKASYKDRVYTKSFALTSAEQQGAINSKKNSADFKPQNLYEYSALLLVQNDEPIIIQLKALATCPQIKLESDLFQFGDCELKDTKHAYVTVQNKSNVSKAELSFQKIPNFSVIPSSYTLRPLQSYKFKLQFEPKSIGKFDVIQKLLINKIYQIDIRCFGIATPQNRNKTKAVQQVTDLRTRQPIKTRVKAFSVLQKSFVSEMRRSTQQEERMKLQLSNIIENKEKFNKVLNDRRTDRIQKQKDEAVQKKWSLYQTKLKDLGPKGKYQEILDQQGVPTNPPIDYEFQSGMNDTKIGKQKIPLPEVRQKLFVTKHINDYQPLHQSANRQIFSRSVTESPKIIFPDTPVNYNHRREIISQLSPSQLALVQVSTNNIDLGQVYVKSRQARYFWVRNSTKKAISVQLKTSSQQLANSYKKAQILKTGDQAGFEIAFCKDVLGDFKSSCKYIINGQHEFEMSVVAKCVPVQIQISANQLKFQFDQSNLQTTTQRKLTLHNPGNSSAFFKFLLGKDKYFTPKIMEGTLKSKQKMSISISLTVPVPAAKKNQYNYTERLVLKVLDGSEATILCSFNVQDPKFTTKCQAFLNKPILCIGHEFQDGLDIKNTSKNSLVIHLESTGNLTVSPNKIKLAGQETKKINIQFSGKIIGQHNTSIVIKPRGGQKKVIQSVIRVIQPQLQFSQEYLNMGVLIVQGISGLSKFTLINKNQISLPLIIDIRSNNLAPQNSPNIQNIALKLLDEQEKLQVLKPVKTVGSQKNQTQSQNLVGQSVDQEQLDNSQSDEEEIIQKNQSQCRKFRLLLKPSKTYTFQAEYFPRQTGKFDFQIPMYIENSIKVLNTPSILAEAIKPQFIFEPSVIDFKRKIVTKPDRCYPKYINVSIKNIDDEDVNWTLDDSSIRKQGIFQIQANKGLLKVGQQITLKASFNPYIVGEYFHKLPLFIQSKKILQPLKYVDVVFKGSASLPNIFFNKREVIMPVVPLGIQTHSSFRIINDGYQNCNLKYQFLDDVAGINVKLHFPQGPNIGITRQKLRVDLIWSFNKPMSFCLKLQFTDDMNRSFVIPVSGTTDNCIFTNYTYFLRNQSKFQIKSQSTLQLVQVNQNVSSSFSLQRKYSSHSLKSNATNKSVMSYLGVAPINQAVLANTIDYINRYLNANLLNTPISQFPGSFIESDGSQIFEIIAFVSAKNNTYPWKYNGNFKGIQRANKLFQQYNELIRMLKIQGAHLNHIRPEYLMSFTDLNTYLSNLPQQKAKSFMPSLMKINHSLFNYLSMQSWITLLYQIFKIYVLSRVNAKNFKSHIGSSSEIPKIYLDQSNFVSVHQNILFYWVEQAINQVLLQERRFTNFDKDFKDGVAIGALLKKYANVQVLKKMKMICQNQEDFKQNANILCGALSQIGLLNHLTPKDIYSPLQRQMLLFILHLYVYLPFYVPKQEPVVFKCILGQQVIRTIELTNPSNKVVNYLTKYQGSQDFKLIGQEKFKIDPKQTYKFQVKFVSRISAEVKGRIMFINVKDQSLTAAPLVFDLKSQISGRISDRIWNITGTIYEQIQFSIDVANKFTSQQMVDFAISYQTEYIFQNSKLKNKNGLVPLSKEDQSQTIYGKSDNVKIRKNGSVSLTLNYIPTSLYTTRTVIYFLNPIVGEFQHQIIAVVQPPSVSGQIRPPMQLTVDQIVNWEYNVNPKNQMINRAKKTIQSLKKKKGQQNKELQKTQAFINEEYVVQISPNPYVSAKQTIKINQKSSNNQDKAKDLRRSQKQGAIKSHNESKLTYKQKQVVDMENKIPFTIVCKNPVYEFTTFVLVYNKSKTDVRRYKVMFTVQPKPLKAILQMNVPARSEVTQNLPVVNNTDRDWVIKILWQPDLTKNGNYFQVPSQFSTTLPVKKNSIGNFPITFKPKWVNKAQAKLTMTNPLTLDHFEYQIIGNGQEPVAEQHIQIRCQAKERIKKQVYVKNPYSQKPITLRVQTDLLNCQSTKKVVIPSGGKQKFQFYVQPMLCGQYTGSITLFQEDGPQYIWYTISVITNFPQAYKTIDLSSQIRSKQLQKIFIPFSGTKQSTFQVIINGNGLTGQESITAKPNQDNFYLLQYLPLQVGQQRGSVCFINNDIGEVLYEFNLRCLAKSPVIINDIKSPLGVSTIIITEFQNPTDRKTTVNVINSNPEQFVLKSNVIKLGPNQIKKVQIEYIPASLQKIESAHIQFVSKDIGQWIYQLSGTGLQPVPFQPTIVYNGLMEQHSESVKFRNPFKYEITIGIKLIPKNKQDHNIFKLLNTAKSKFSIDSFGVLEIPFSFIPIACSKYQCQIIAMISQKIFWTFPIVGITQINTGKTIANLTIPCRQSTSAFAQITLEGVQNFKSNNQYSYKLENIPAIYQKFVQKNLLIDCSKNHLNHAKDGLQFDFNFKPMKPIKIGFDFIVIRKEGSRWRFRVNVQGTQPEPDDIIQIESNLLVTTTVSFKITNSQKVNAPFKAKFTSDSAHQFSVQPKEGVLAKFGSKGTNFFVSFTPVQYGKQKRGKLIIQTNDMYWSYILKGSLPKYVPPQNQHRKSRISSSKQ